MTTTDPRKVDKDLLVVTPGPTTLGENVATDSVEVPAMTEDTNARALMAVDSGNEKTRDQEILDAAGIDRTDPNADAVIDAVCFVGRAGFSIKVGGVKFFEGGRSEIKISPEHLRTVAPKLAVVMGALTLLPSVGFAQNMEVGSVPDLAPVEIYGVDYIMVMILVLLIGGAGALAYLKKKKKRKSLSSSNASNSQPQVDNSVKLNTALQLVASMQATTTSAQAQQAKSVLASLLFQEAPALSAEIENELAPTQEELKELFEVKKSVDAKIDAAVLAVDNILEPDNSDNLAKLDAQKNALISTVATQYELLSVIYTELYEKYQSLLLANKKYLASLYMQEILKIGNIKKLLVLKKKIWLSLFGEQKFALLKNKAGKSNDPQIKMISIEKEVQKLFAKKGSLDGQTFADSLNSLENAYLKAKKDMTEAVEGGSFKKTLSFGHKGYVYLNSLSGKFDASTGFEYTVEAFGADNNPTEHSLPLAPDVSIEIWQTQDGQAYINLYKQGVLQQDGVLDIKNDSLVVKSQGSPTSTGDTPLEDWINESSEKAFTPLQVDLPPDANVILDRVGNLSAEHLASDSLSGRRVEIDHDAFEHTLLKIDTAYYAGDEVLALRFNLSQAWHKNVLNHLISAKTVSVVPATFNFENKHGHKKNINQKVHAFTVESANGVKGRVMVPEGSDGSLAIATNVRIFIPKNQNPTAEDVKEIFKQAAMAMGMAEHVTQVTAESRKDLQKQLKGIRREKSDPSGLKIDVAKEYATEGVEHASIAKLRQAGLHSVYHSLPNGHLVDTIKAGRLLATTQRWSKGIFTEGMSSGQDIATGGAKSTFTRVHTKASANASSWHDSSKTALIFEPEIFERMDCYCYPTDKYGSLVPSTFDQRVSPLELVNSMKAHYLSSNEVMFNDSVDFKHLKYIVASDPHATILALKQGGITVINGTPVEQFVISYNEFTTKQI